MDPDHRSERVRSLLVALAASLAGCLDLSIAFDLSSSCSVDTDCPSPHYCVEHTCLPPGLPVNRGPPQIVGTVEVPGFLAAEPGTWIGTGPLAFSHQWQRCDAGGGSCVDLSGETAATFRVRTAYVDSTIRVKVTATNVAGSAEASSAPTLSVPAPAVHPYFSAVFKSAPVAYWRFEEAAGTTVADATGHGADALLRGNAATAPEGAFAGSRSLSLDGSGDCALVDSAHAPKTPATGWTVEVLFRFTGGTSPLPNLVRLGPGCAGYRMRIVPWEGDGAGNLKMEHSFNLGTSDCSGTFWSIPVGIRLGEGTWHHYVHTTDGMTRRAYLDGAECLNEAEPLPALTFPGAEALNFGIGCSVPEGDIATIGFSETFTGNLDEVAIYDYPLSAQEVLGHVLAIGY